MVITTNEAPDVYHRLAPCFSSAFANRGTSAFGSARYASMVGLVRFKLALRIRTPARTCNLVGAQE